jgi:ATP-binding cassette subfamily B protein
MKGTMHWCLIAGFLSALVGVIEVFTAIILGSVIDSALDSGTENLWSDNTLLFVGALAFFLLLRPITFGLSSAVTSILVVTNLNPLVHSRLHRWVLGQNIGFFDDDFAGRIAQKEMQAARAVSDVVGETINVVFFALASLFGSVLLLTTINLWMAIGLGIWAVLYLLAIRWFLPRVRARGKARAGARATVTGQVVDTITNIKTVKLFAQRSHEDRAAIGAMGYFREEEFKFKVMATLFRLTMISLAGILPVVLVGATLYLWTEGLASPGEIVTAGAVSIRIAQMTGWVGFTIMVIYANVGEVEDAMRTLAPSNRLDETPTPQMLDGRGHIEFVNVTFGYGREDNGVQGISLTLKPGERLGIVGASGAGKSTLVALLLRLYDVDSGAVRIGDRDVRETSEEDLRRQIGMVTQDTAMFNRSARENILYGRPDATEEELFAAAKRAEAHEFILDLEDHAGRKGYDAHLGERGVKLSGGQRQRIALARAILKDAPILVLDEATSALDSEVEAAIQTALDQVIEGKTVLAIAHRLSTIAKMDRIVVLDDGQIVEEGTHEALLAKGGFYARFWARQTDGFAA